MKIIDSYAEKKFIEILKIIRKEPVQWRCVYIPAFDELPKVVDRMGLEINILLKDIYKAFLFPMPNNDVYFFCRGGDEKILSSIVSIMKGVALDEEANIDVQLFDLSCDFDKLTQTAKTHLIQKKPSEETDLKNSALKAAEIPPLVVETDPQIISQMGETRRTASKLNVMLVDDEPLTLKMVESILKGCNVIKCSTPQQALDEYFVAAPHVVFMDINMPPYSGHDLLEKIKQYDADAFIVMLSANAYPTDIKKVMSLGAKGFIGKPFSKAKIFNYLLAYQDLIGRKLL